MKPTAITLRTLTLTLTLAAGHSLAVGAERTILASRDLGGLPADALANAAAISGNGRFVAFTSDADNLTGDAAAAFPRVFVFDTETNLTTAITVGVLNAAPNNSSEAPGISADGRFVVFYSDATNLDLINTPTSAHPGWPQCYIHDRQTGTTELVSLSGIGAWGNDNSVDSGYPPAVSDDGRFVAFVSRASNLVSGGVFRTQVYLRDRGDAANGIPAETFLISVASGTGVASNLSAGLPKLTVANGQVLIAYRGTSNNIVPGDTNTAADIFLGSFTPRTPGNFSTSLTNTRVSTTASGGQAGGISRAPDISDDGNLVVFASRATNLDPLGGDANGNYDVFIKRIDTGAIRRISNSSDGDAAFGFSDDPVISGDGSTVAFQSNSPNLIDGDTNGQLDAYVYSVATQTLSRVSLADNGEQSPGGGAFPAISNDGRFVAFESTSSLTSVATTVSNVYIRDRNAPGTGCLADVANTDGDPTPDGVVDNGDFQAFFAAFFLAPGDPAQLVADVANTDGDPTPDGVVDNGDFQAFFAAFFACVGG